MFELSNLQDFAVLVVIFQSCITQQENVDLCNIPEPHMIKNALWSIHCLKSSVPDGMSGLFYKKHRHIVGLDIIDFVKEFFYTRVMNFKVNTTLLALLPKKKKSSY